MVEYLYNFKKCKKILIKRREKIPTSISTYNRCSNLICVQNIILQQFQAKVTVFETPVKVKQRL